MRSYKGVVKGNIIRLTEESEFSKETEATVILKPILKDQQNEIQERQIRLLNKGFDMGKLLFSKREELHDR